LDDPSDDGSETEENDERLYSDRKHRHRKRKDNFNNVENFLQKGSATTLIQPNNQSLQTRKISVGRQNKLLKHRGRSSSLPFTESGSENFNHNCHANANTRENQRVIKIDLNNMSWEEESRNNTPFESDFFCSNSENGNNSPSECGSPRCIINPSFTTNSKNDCNGNQVVSINSVEQTRNNIEHDHNNIELLKASAVSADFNLNGGAQVFDINGSRESTQNNPTTTGHDEVDIKRITNKNRSISISSSLSDETQSGEMVKDQKTTDSTPINRRNRLKKTISFDEQILNKEQSSESSSVKSGK
jgi:hypothetical protein